MSKQTRTQTSILLSIVWLTVVLGLLSWKWPEAKGLSLNEWGDFMAGTAAILAFIWIVTGYFLQTQELRENTKALEAQRDEIKDQNMKLVKLYQALNSSTSALNRVGNVLQEQLELNISREPPPPPPRRTSM